LILMQSQGTGRDSPSTFAVSASAADGYRPAADHYVLAHLADDIDRAIAALPTGSLWWPWLARLSRVLRTGAGMRSIRAVARRDGGEVA
jgi:hypothetical protein